MKILILFLAFTCITVTYGQAPSLTTIYFDFNSSEISETELLKIVDMNETDVTITITEISAHTDSAGSESYNLKLAQRRLEAVLNSLKYDDPKTKVLGEKQANETPSYIDSKFRKVEIHYTVQMGTPGVIDGIIEEPTTLRDGVTDFITSDEDDLSFDLSVHFIPGQAVPLQESYAELNQLVTIMQDNPKLDAFLHGHVCCSNNQFISEKRAEFVYLYLIKKGIAEERLQHIGHGNTQPKADPEQTEHDRIQNRRVNVVFTKH